MNTIWTKDNIIGVVFQIDGDKYTILKGNTEHHVNLLFHRGERLREDFYYIEDCIKHLTSKSWKVVEQPNLLNLIEIY